MQPGNIPVPGYLVQTPEGTNILIDTGWPESYVDEPQAPPGITLEINAEDTITARLASIGLEPADINILICTHFDDDHAGNNSLFPSAKHIVQRAQFEAAESGHPRFRTGHPYLSNSTLQYQLVDGDTSILDGIDLLETSGHVPGHQSVLVHLPDKGPVLLAIDAVPHHAYADGPTRDILPMDMDEKEVRASTEKLARIVKERNVGLTVYGHDTEQWLTLRHAPHYYS